MTSPLWVHHRLHRSSLSYNSAVSCVYIICLAHKGIRACSLPWSCKQSACRTFRLTNRSQNPSKCHSLSVSHSKNTPYLKSSFFLYFSVLFPWKPEILNGGEEVLLSLPRNLPRGRRSNVYQD